MESRNLTRDMKAENERQNARRIEETEYSERDEREYEDEDSMILMTGNESQNGVNFQKKGEKRKI